MKVMVRMVVLVLLKASWPPILLVSASCTGSCRYHQSRALSCSCSSGNQKFLRHCSHQCSSLSFESQNTCELPGLERAPCSSVSSGQSLGGEVVVLPRAKHILAARVEAITAVLVAIIIIVPRGEAVLWIIPASVVLARHFVVACVIPAPADGSSVCLLPAQLRRVGHHLMYRLKVGRREPDLRRAKPRC